jgi:cyclopropane fatty-acyl-phospholipid synthase-like methyltransferase
LNLNEKSYDAIISLMTFHHVKNIESVLKKFYSLLKNNGKVIIGDLVKEDGSFHQDDSPAHKGFNLMEIKSKIQDCGFQVDDIYVYNTIEKPDKNGQTREFEQFILTAHK